MTDFYFSCEPENLIFDNDLIEYVKNAVNTTLDFFNITLDTEVSITFTNNECIKELNKEYRNKDSATDVLSFPMYDFLNGDLGEFDDFLLQLGDIVISVERAKEQSIEFGHSIKREISFLTVHSMLHLLGYDHERNNAEEKIMFEVQDKIMNLLNISRDN